MYSCLFLIGSRCSICAVYVLYLVCARVAATPLLANCHRSPPLFHRYKQGFVRGGEILLEVDISMADAAQSLRAGQDAMILFGTTLPVSYRSTCYYQLTFLLPSHDVGSHNSITNTTIRYCTIIFSTQSQTTVEYLV